MTRERQPYSRIYWSILEDPKFDGIREDMRLYGSWALLLICADMSYPSPAFFPPMVSRPSIAKLVEADLIEILPHGRYKVAGLEAERERRSRTASQNSSLRWGRPAEERGQPASRRTRFKVLERDGYRCRYCGRPSSEIALDVDHVTSLHDGGTNDMENLVAACIDCNAGKSAYPLRAHPNSPARASEPESARIPRQDEDKTRQDKPTDEGAWDGDPAIIYWQLTGAFPGDKTLPWIDDLSTRYGTTAVIRALATAHIADRSARTLLGRTQDRLRAEARELDVRERKAEQVRLAEKRSNPPVMDAWREEYRQRIQEQYGDAA